MGFFYSSNKKSERVQGPSKQSVDFLHRSGCAACPLDQARCKHPKMEPSGQGSVYVLGANPTAEADRRGHPLSEFAKDAIFQNIPSRMRGSLRFNNIVRTHTGGSLTPVMIECCRPSIIADIEEQAPAAVVGIGEETLQWITGMTGIRKWTGRWLPAKIGQHVCWFLPLSDPVEVWRTQKFEWSESEEQFAWRFQVKRAFEMIDGLGEAPEPHDKEYALEGVISIDGSNGVEDLERLHTLLTKIGGEGMNGVDLETNGTRPYAPERKILTAAVGGREQTVAFALDHRENAWGGKLRKEAHAVFVEYLMTSKAKKAVHQLAFELEWCAVKYDKRIIRAGRWEDTATQAWVLDERNKMGKPDCLSLEFLCMQYFGFNLKQLSNLNREALDDEPLVDVLTYNGMDAKYHRSLFMRQMVRIKAEGFVEQYDQMNARIASCVLTQIKGVPLDQKQIRNLKRYYEENIALIEEDIADTEAYKLYRKKYGKNLEYGNPKDVLKLVQEVLGDDAINKKEKISAGAEVLLRIDDPIAPLILEWRGNEKALSTYVKPVLADSQYVYEGGDIIHPQIATTRTDTSRTSSNEPNSQNWPKRKEASKVVRAQIAPLKKEERVVSFDFAGIQARNIAMESLDPTLIDSFWTGYDPHGVWTKWLAEEAGTDWGFVHKAGSVKQFYKDGSAFKHARGVIKNSFVFPSFFGAGARSISIQLEVEQGVIEKMQDELFGEFPIIKEWQDSVKQHYAEHGWVAGLTGIRRRAPCSPNQLINAPIQADEAWIVLDCMNRLSEMAVPGLDAKPRRDLEGGLEWHLQPNMEIHDDFTFIWPKHLIDRLAPIVITAMLAVPFKWAHVVPIEIEMSVGTNWANQKEIGKFRSDTWTERDYKREDYA